MTAWNGEDDKFVTDEKDTWKNKSQIQVDVKIDNELEATSEFVEGVISGMNLCAELVQNEVDKQRIRETIARWEEK